MMLNRVIEPMRQFIDTNPRLQSRFTRYVEFEDYTNIELVSIFEDIALRQDYKLSQDARTTLEKTIDRVRAANTSNFGNAREVRNLLEKVIEQHALRIGIDGLAEIDVILPVDITSVPLDM